MAEKSDTTEVTPGEDFKRVAGLLEAKKLDELVAKLDPGNVTESLEAVPKEIIRLLAVLLSTHDVESWLEDLDTSDRVVALALLESAKRYGGAAFVRALFRVAETTPDVWTKLGTRIDVSTAAARRRVEMENAWTDLSFHPHVTLTDRRVYCEIGLFRRDRLLFRCELELCDVIAAARAFLKAAQLTLSLLEENAKSVDVRVDMDRCEHEMEQIRKIAETTAMKLKATNTRLVEGRETSVPAEEPPKDTGNEAAAE